MANEIAGLPQSVESISWGCGACKVGAYGLALAVLAVATAGWAGITVPVALAFLAALLAATTATVDFILTSLCDWIGLCD